MTKILFTEMTEEELNAFITRVEDAIEPDKVLCFSYALFMLVSSYSNQVAVFRITSSSPSIRKKYRFLISGL